MILTPARPHAQITADYDTLLASFAVSDDSLAEPATGETLLAVRRRLTAAAARHGWMLSEGRTENAER